ncbi:MerR family transcriptional regulator [Ideonella oryzae]|uniref:MerR family DNA-binding transcriptional regulator n=1 Tax=Ideonella oryzae TaxID=2937441 RepID=A0ABT1BPD5_9BURK|nr:MerR family DNA-binding transcriptional regulator [Ideonella oryzae]MCO5977441.1 MerR family DNA-binding transcriptional regulator [Ideonella oryzae]
MSSLPRPIPAAQLVPEGEPRPAPVSYTITELAQEFEITPRAIRFYEDLGLLQPRREGRHRIYSHRDRTRLKLTLRGKRLGLPLQDIKQLVDMYETGTDTRPQLEAFIQVLRAHRRQLEQQLEDIRVTLEEIDEHEHKCRQLLEKSVNGVGGAGA